MQKSKSIQSMGALLSKSTNPILCLRLSYLSLSSPCSACTSRKSKTSFLKGWVWVKHGDDASANKWEKLVAYNQKPSKGF